MSAQSLNFAYKKNLNPDFLMLNAIIFNAAHHVRESIYMSVLKNRLANSASR